MSDALTDITENRLDTAPGNERSGSLAGKHRGTVADDDIEGRREPAGQGRHRRTLTAD
ncbi:hypothetical protein [Streptacidiphilus sp. P02-A3a]|uniref:hypothetical protein n=1 Tax=Streptacidiphilus sp. P02-A3a TaxID=2704468 RepID=UPI0015FAC59B|nr:hypothetical protein [Streptacidiphilus sp. P02-A3a]QMU68340.1 hypothetical protein GXP74_08950 [Streptacidiphilus sp. P02-A3a]